MKNKFSLQFDVIIANVARMWIAFSIRITVWVSDIFKSSEEEPSSKKRDTRNKSPAKTGCSQQWKMLKKTEKQLIVSKIKSLTDSDVTSCNRRVVGGTIRFGVESVMVARDETNLDIGATSSHQYKVSISNSCNGLFSLRLQYH